MKNKVKISFILCFVLLILLSIKSLATVEIKDYQINCDIKDNGNVAVVENVTFTTDEYKASFLRILNEKNDINVNNSANKIVLNSVKVNGQEQKREAFGSEGRSGIYEYRIKDNIYSIKVLEPIQEGEINIAYEYVLENPIVKYQDCAEFFWNFIKEDNEFDIKNLSINVKLPINDITKDIFAFAYGTKNGEINKNRNEITIKTTDLKANQPFDVRIVFDKEAIIESNKSINKSILKNYSKIQESFFENREIFKIAGRYTLRGIVIILTILIILAFAVTFTLVKSRKIINWISGILMAVVVLITGILSIYTVEGQEPIKILLMIFLTATSIIYSNLFKKIDLKDKMGIFVTAVHFIAFQIANISLLMTCNLGLMYLPYLLEFIFMQYLLRRKNKEKKDI